MPGSPVVPGDCRSWVVPKLWLDLLGRGTLSSEGLREPEQGGLGVPEKWTGETEGTGGGGQEWQKRGRELDGKKPEVGGRGLGPDTYHGHMASLPPGCWGRSRARRQEVDTA